ncbi:hypothetical protein [uncultured Clostridium sp.]|uniref:hypothetical protein n=1 Tax=uncultured Clostridium sp. TaxID=59620 RepID=UPI0025D40636|nr:hypothetical protein [uncultured Clostridium sp.]
MLQFIFAKEIIEFLNARPKLYQCFGEYKALEVKFPKGAWRSHFFIYNIRKNYSLCQLLF